MKEANIRVKTVWQSLPTVLTGGIITVLLLIVGILVIKYGRKLIKKAFKRYFLHHPNATHGETLQTLITSLFNVIMYFAVGLTCLDALGVDVKSLLTVAGFSGVAIAFGCQTLVKDVVSGMFLWFEGRCNVGDVVTVAGQTGRIEAVALRTTTLRATDGSLFVIPNGEIRTVVNMSNDFRCAVVDVTVAHGQDYDLALRVLNEAMKDLNQEFTCIEEDPKVVGYISMDRGAAVCRIECRCSVDDCWTLERGIRLYAMKALSRAGIKP